MSPPCHVALILPTKQDYEAATLLLDKVLLRHTLTASGADCTLGCVGPHTVVLASSPNHPTISYSVSTTVDNLLEEYPSIRAGILVGNDARAPRGGSAQAGDIVIGLPRATEPGLIQFESKETCLEQRFSAATHLSRPPRTVRAAASNLTSPPVSYALTEHLANGIRSFPSTTTGPGHNKVTPLDLIADTCVPNHQPKVLSGKVASSNERLQDSSFVQKQGTDNKILCFETAAAHLKPHLPFLVVCGVVATTPPSSPDCTHASKAAVLYAIFLIRHLNATMLAEEHAFASLFRHEPFNIERLGFRLLQVHKGTSLPIVCEVFQAYLDDPATLVPYDALSYVWGETYTTDIVMLNGRVMPVTANLHDALQHLRHRDQDRIVWADALCIDQTHIRERGHQVKHMGDIYEKAERVTIWLGFVNEEAGLLCSALKELERQAPGQAFNTWPHGDPRWKECWAKIMSTYTLGAKFDRLLLIGLQSLLEKPWFKRIWILQEVAKAKRAVVYCNKGSINARSFALAPFLLGEKPDELCQAVLDIMPGPARQSSWWSERRNLCTLLWRFRGCHATDPRDRVYALLGIAQDMAEGEIQADYSKNEEEVLWETCHYLFIDDAIVGALAIHTMSDLQAELPRLSARALKLKLDSRKPEAIIEKFVRRQGTIDPMGQMIVSDVIHLGEVSLSLLSTRFDPPFLANQSIDETIVCKTIQIRPKTLRFPLANTAGGADISQKTVLDAIKAGLRVIQIFLRFFPEANTEIPTSEEAVLRAIQAGPNVLLFLLQQVEEGMIISKRTVIETIEVGPSALQFFLQQPHVRFEVNGNTIKAVGCMRQSVFYMGLLEEQWREDSGSGEVSQGWWTRVHVSQSLRDKQFYRLLRSSFVAGTAGIGYRFRKMK
ncbi:hypothetical protein NM208_g3046 [Fusarium decemcellulare]|uniref:Uncharacterized protein n=1 Tax=Fusarium decemcellulare TaxID=57161 RepID=A0ACC1SQF2_9HYPO|nr:hypothetical protein NM208_g3046 [Fusarium decemcellulare]